MRQARILLTLAAPAAMVLGLGCVAEGDVPAGERAAEARSALGQPLVPEAEPNGAGISANPIAKDTVVRGNVFPNGDADYFSFQGVAGERVYAAVMSAFSANGSTDADLDILAPDGTTVLETDDLNGSIGGLSPSIGGTTLTQTGTHFARVRHFSATGQQRPYDLHFKVQGGAPAPELEPNDMTPQPLPASGWISGTIAAATDVDVYSLTLQAGDTVFASLDLDPTRDGTEFNGALAIGPFAGAVLQVNDGGSAGPDSEALFATVKSAGTYGVAVTGAAAGDYGLSVSVHAAAPSVGCTTYASSDVPKTIPAAGGQVTSVITVPGTPRIGDVDVSVQLDHAAPSDVDAHLVSPAGNTNGLFTDVGSATFPNLDITIDEQAAFPAASFTLLNGLMVEPELDYRMHWLDGENGGGTWTLVLNDDTNNVSGGTLTGWSITVCDAPIPNVTCSGGNVPVTPLSTDFEANDGGFTHIGTLDAWALGTPTAAPIASCNSGTQCWKTNLAGAYNASSNQDLVSAPIDLTQATGAVQLRWAMKYQIETASNDHAWVEVREVGGANPKRLWEFLDATMTTSVGTPVTTLQESAGWGTHYADISAYAGKLVEVRFHLDSNATTQLAGLAVDDVSVVGCPLAVCGNGTPEPGEACDDGNLTSGDGCDANCAPTGCGNGVVTAGESCDDGNAIDGDGCDANCTPTGCGNGVVTAGEGCDDGNAVEGDGCDSNCTASACGNGVVAPGEGCDDGNAIDGDGCDSNCTPTACGNGVVTMGEGCDDGNAVLGDGCDDGPAGNCTASGCGNGVTAGGEGCDDGNALDGDGCDANCTATGCGNGIITGAETCDDGNIASGDGCDANCTPTGCPNGVQTGTEACDDGNAVDGDGCDSNCTASGCGNGVADPTEGCDDGNAVEGDGCDSNCTPSGCGNGVADPTEECDDGNTADGDGCSSTCTTEGQGGAGGGGGSGGGTGTGGSGTGGSGTGGSGNTTGAGGAGGAGSGSSSSGGSSPRSSNEEDGGCGCRVAGDDPSEGRWAIALALVGLGLVARRRRGR